MKCDERNKISISIQANQAKMESAAAAASLETATKQSLYKNVCIAITSLSLIFKFHIQDANKMIIKIRKQNTRNKNEIIIYLEIVV